jgi:hypothetical protein
MTFLFPIIEKIKTTVIAKKESSVSEILKILNKISEKNYDKLKEELCIHVKSVTTPEDIANAVPGVA